LTWLIPSFDVADQQFDVADQQFSISQMASSVVEMQRATPEEAEMWFADVHTREEHREFFAATIVPFVPTPAANACTGDPCDGICASWPWLSEIYPKLGSECPLR
jgi:hypothetical protein